MSEQLPRVIVICGPTATGKTALAIELAQRIGGEIINADSMQVYRHMDIGTAKPTARERQSTPFHLLDVADPDETFSTGRFKELGRRALAEILARGRVPMIAGGTGLYIKALVHGLWDGPAADPGLRADYKKLEAAAPGSLHRRLAQVDPARAAQVHPADYVRLERALEVFDLTGRPISQWQQEHGFAEAPFRVRKIGLRRPREELGAAVDRRVEAMMDRGWLAEVRQLRRLGYGPEFPSQAALGYRELHRFCDGEQSLVDAVARTKSATRKFAKRQRTWFRADPEIRWFDAVEEKQAAIEWGAAFLEKNVPSPSNIGDNSR